MAGRGTDIKLGPGVKDAGGLAIIGTERHESRRVDRQLRGRSGRQGDPGSSQFFVSLEDNLMRLFGSDRIAKVKEPQEVEYGKLREGQMLFTYLHLAPDEPQTCGLMDSGCIAIAYEIRIAIHSRQISMNPNLGERNPKKITDQAALSTSCAMKTTVNHLTTGHMPGSLRRRQTNQAESAIIK